jgi:molybdate transport system substrate-binding protein
MDIAKLTRPGVMRLLRFLIPAILLTAGLAASTAAIAGEKLTVFAASSLTDAMTSAGEVFDAQGTYRVQFSFASSSTLARHVEAGAPAGVVALASEDWAAYLEERDQILADTRVSPFGNRLVLIAPKGTGAALETPTPQQIADLIGSTLGPDDRLALGDPAHVPAGIFARQALEYLGIWSSVSQRLAPADNVRAALALVARGEAPLGIVYATDARLSTDVRTIATLPAASHAPIAYPIAITRDGDSPQARAFLAFLTSEEGLAIFQRFGFTGN